MNGAERSDEELIGTLRRNARELNTDPLHIITMGVESISWSRSVTGSSLGTNPIEVEDYMMKDETYPGWPEWIRQIVPEGSVWRKLTWADGSYTIRLENHRALTLAGHRFKGAEERL